jgi:NET1-associated nuclear protein 1 (U3 small nucleolar RNA-associated protein 17)
MAPISEAEVSLHCHTPTEVPAGFQLYPNKNYQQAIANKRKREADEQSRRKRRRHDRTPRKANLENGQPSRPDTPIRTNGLESGEENEGEKALVVAKPDTPQVEKREKRKHRSSSRKEKSVKENTCKWAVSNPIGGRMLDIDPVITDDEK